MALLVFYCERCNRRISPEEMEDEDVVKTENGYICSNCASMLNLPTIKQNKKSKSRPKQTEKKRESRITTYSIREEAVDEYQLYGLDKKAPARPIPQPTPKKSNSLLILSMVGLVVVVVIIIAAAGGGSSSESFTDRGDTSDYSSSERTETTDPTDTTQDVGKKLSIFEDPWERKEQSSKPETGETENDVSSSTAEGARKKPWMEEFRDTMEFKRNHPNDYIGVKRRLTEIIQKYESRMKWGERDRIIAEMDGWDAQWQKKAEKAFQNALQKEKEAESISEKRRVWEEFPKRFLDVGDTKRKVEEALQFFELVEEAFTSFDEAMRKAEEALAKKDYMEAGYILNEWKGEYIEPFEGTDDEERILSMFSEHLKRLEQMQQRIEKEFEEYLSQKQQEEKSNQPSEGDQQPQPTGDRPWSDWNAYKKILEQTFSNLDSNPNNSELRPGSSAAVNRVNRLGQNTDFDGKILVNRGAADGGIIPSFKKMYLWETYTFTLRIRVVNEGARIGIRMNAVENRGITGGSVRLPVSGNWMEVKVEVGKTSAEVYVNGQHSNSIQLSEERNPPTGFPSILLPPDGKAEIENWRIELKTIRK